MPIWLQSALVIILVLIVARFIKRNVKIFQKYFIPSALIGGFGALLIGPQFLGWIPLGIINEWKIYPSLLISIVFAGLFLGHSIPSPRKIWRCSAPMLAFGHTLAWGQYLIGILLTLFVLGPFLWRASSDWCID
jgi:ESS family glutamate:Na+ symporter